MEVKESQNNHNGGPKKKQKRSDNQKDVVKNYSPDNPMLILHEHELYLADPFKIYSKYKGWWKCDCCKTKMHRNELLFHCYHCDFDVCASCYYQVVGHHRHLNHTFEPLVMSRGKCSDCHKEVEINMHHCKQCVVQYCPSCFQSVYVLSLHPHPLYISRPNEIYPGKYWKCDKCNEVFGKDQFTIMFHCREYQVDFCFNCVKKAIDGE
ncbi:Zinc finger protein [Entamoeba marina]